MHKIATISKTIDNKTRTVFVSHITDYFSKKFLTKWNTVITINIKTHNSTIYRNNIL